MGYYKDGKYVYTSMDVGNGVCDQDHYNKQQQAEQKKKDNDNAGGMTQDDIKKPSA